MQTHRTVTGLLIYENKWVAGGRADDECMVNGWDDEWGGLRTDRLACGSASGSMGGWAVEGATGGPTGHVRAVGRMSGRASDLVR